METKVGQCENCIELEQRMVDMQETYNTNYAELDARVNDSIYKTIDDYSNAELFIEILRRIIKFRQRV
jgi:hypothetical protein